MAVVIPQVVTEDRASGAQVIDGSLRFNADNSTHLKRTFSSAGNRKKWTWSAWVKKTKLATQEMIFQANNGGSLTSFYINSADVAMFLVGGGSIVFQTSRKFRDTSNFMHLLLAVDTTQSDAFDRIKLYVNGERIPSDQYATAPAPGLNTEYEFNNSCDHYFSGTTYGHINYYMTNAYFIDGLALGSGYFGFTDPLTNTWRPKKFSGEFTNSNPNNGTTWSGQVSGSFYAGGYDQTELFDGSLSTQAQSTGATWTTNIPFTSLRIYGKIYGAGSRSISVNGTDVTSQLGSNGAAAAWHTITGVSSPLTSIQWDGTTYSGSTPDLIGLYAIEIDGNILIDGANYTGVNSFYLPMDGNTPVGNDESGRGNDFTPVNFGGTVGLDKATGALPILNTNGGGTVAHVGVRTDPYAANLVLALPLVGSKDDVSNQINSGSTTKTTAVTGNAASNSSASNFYNASFYFDGSDDYTDTTITALGTRDFTLEFWCYTAVTTGYQTLLEYGDHSSNGFIMTYRDGTGMFVRNVGAVDISNATYASPSEDMPKDKWHHIALTRESNTAKLFINGKYIGNATFSTNYTATNIRLGHATYSAGSAEDLNGYIQDVRLYDGAVKYTGTTINEQSFIVPATSPDILPDTPSGVATKTALTKITDGAVAFDRTGDYLYTTLSSADFTMGTGDFTVECFVYIKGSNEVGIFQISDTSGGLKTGSYGNTIAAGATPGSNYWQIYGAGAQTTGGSGKMGVNRWHHLAYVRSSGTSKLYVDGISVISVSDTTDYDGTYIAVGGYYSTSYLMDGFISNFRVIKGTALYTSNFTPPTEPLTNVTNTKLLCCQSNRAQADASVSPQINSTINAGTPWSFFTTTDTGTAGPKDFYGTGNDANHLFDGDTSVDCYGGYGADGTNSRIIFKPRPALAISSKLEVYVGYYSKIKVNGADYNTGGEGSGATWVTVSDGSNFTGTLNELILENTSNANIVRASAIRVDETTVLKDPINWEGDTQAVTFNPFNTDIETIRGQETSYCTMNPLSIGDGTPPTLSNGNLTVKANTTIFSRTNGNTYATSGKFYAEVTKVSGQTSDDSIGIGARTYQALQSTNPYIGRTADSYGFYGNARKVNNNSFTSYGNSWGQLGDVMGLLMDLDSGTISLSINGIDQGVAYTGIDASLGWTFCVAPYNNQEYSLNFGQKPFRFTPPDGFQTLSGSTLRPDTVVPDSSQFFAAVPYTGNSATNKITTGFAPDFVWIKNRDDGYAHCLFDTVRGAGKRLESDATYGEDDYILLNTFNDNGFTLGVQGGGGAFVQNTSGVDSMSWSWKAGGNKNTFNIDDVGYASAAAAGLDGGSLDPSGASVNTKSKFGIYTWAGHGSSNETLAHGLGQQPDFMICKKKSTSGNSWVVWHKSIATTEYLILNDEVAKATDATLFNSHTNDSDNLWSLGTNNSISDTGQSAVAYLWCDVPGLQKFGSYPGNSSTDGPVIELGFRPRFLIVKNVTDGSRRWVMIDTERYPINGPQVPVLWADYTSAESTTAENQIDILANGFKWRYNNGNVNVTGKTFIYMAWAEAPAFNMFGASSNAR